MQLRNLPCPKAPSQSGSKRKPVASGGKRKKGKRLAEGEGGRAPFPHFPLFPSPGGN